MNLIREISRYFVGLLFIFSGIIKVNDPVGTAIKLEEYFVVFSYDILPFFEWLIPFALIFSVILSVTEVVIGIGLIIGYKTKIITRLLLAMILFFTFLTFYSAYFNKVTDCGCFGDAIPLNPWQSFFKDIILLILITILFIKYKEIKAWTNYIQASVIMLASAIFLVFMCNVAIHHLPFIDFRNYEIGNHIPSLMQPSGKIKYEYIMEKEGQEYIFETYPTDKTYVFKSMNVLNPEVYPKITDFTVWNDNGDFTDEIFQGTNILILYQNLKKTNLEANPDIQTFVEAINGKTNIIFLTSLEQEIIENILTEMNLSNLTYYFIDETVIKAMIRSSPGIVLIKEGTILGKWHYNDIPTLTEIEKLL